MDQKNKQLLGNIALDMDGTITLDKLSVPAPVIAFLHEQHKKGWRLIIATGRPMSLALLGLTEFKFPFLLLAQNGTIAMDTQSKKVLFRRYLPVSHLAEIEKAYEGISGDFVVYNGFENQDRVYWRSKRFDANGASYVHALTHAHFVEPIAIESLSQIAEDKVPLVKCFGVKSEIQSVMDRLSQNPHFNLTLIRDPYVKDMHMLLITDRLASKGQAVLEAIRLTGEKKTIIAAGDDENDISLLSVADISIAMAHAPKNLISMAHLIAPPTVENGIIPALKMAIARHGK